MDDNENFSEKEKPHFILVKKANVFVKYTGRTHVTAGQCHEFRVKMGWTHKDYLGEAERDKKGEMEKFSSHSLVEIDSPLAANFIAS